MAHSYNSSYTHFPPVHSFNKTQTPTYKLQQPTPLKPSLSPQSSTRLSISKQSKINNSEIQLRRNLSDLQAGRLRPSIKQQAVQQPSPESKQPRFDNQILAIFLKNNGGYLDDSDDSDDDNSNHPNSSNQSSYHPTTSNPILIPTEHQLTNLPSPR